MVELIQDVILLSCAGLQMGLAAKTPSASDSCHSALEKMLLALYILWLLILFKMLCSESIK